MGKKLLSMMLALGMALGMAVCGGAEGAIVTVHRDLDEMYTIWGLEWDMPLEEALQKIDENGGWDREYDQLYKMILFRPWTAFFYELNIEETEKKITVYVLWKEQEDKSDKSIWIEIIDDKVEEELNINTFRDAVNVLLRKGFQITAGGYRKLVRGRPEVCPWIRKDGKPDIEGVHESILDGKSDRYWVVLKNISVYMNVYKERSKAYVNIVISGDGIPEYSEEFRWTQEDARIFTEI